MPDSDEEPSGDLCAICGRLLGAMSSSFYFCGPTCQARFYNPELPDETSANTTGVAEQPFLF